jgi:ubiquinone/menaquinone biosynthesis C-methylase UbiE
MSKLTQETVFIQKEADSWFERNAHSILEPANENHNVIQALKKINFTYPVKFIDLGGGAGKVSAGIKIIYPDWGATVLEPSGKAVQAGQDRFPEVQFLKGSLTQAEDMPNENFDLAIVCGVFTWIDRELLSQAIANVDKLIRPGGYLVINDFETPYPRANPYHHHPGLYTYKQDYTLPFMALNLYTEIYRQSGQMQNHTKANEGDPYDTWWTTAILQKDITGRYRR